MSRTSNQESRTFKITPTLSLLYTRPPIPGYENYIGTYLFLGEKKALIDVGPGAAVPGLLAALAEAGLHPDAIDYIILTHIHIDHAGGTGTALKEMKNACVVVHPRGRAHLIDPAVLWKASIDTLGQLAREYGEIEPVPADRIVNAEDEMKLDLMGTMLEVVMTPGHAAHHLCIFEKTSGILVAGDAAGIYTGGYLRLTTPPPFRRDDYLASLDKLLALNPRRLCYAHLGAYNDAVPRLKSAREKLLRWYAVAQSAAKADKSTTETLEVLKGVEPDLESYLSKLDRDEYQRDYEELSNSILGLMGKRPSQR